MSSIHSIATAVIISDCIDENARVRQQCRFASLFSVEPSYIGISSSHPELEAAGHLVDILDAHRLSTPVSSRSSSPSYEYLQETSNAESLPATSTGNPPLTAVIIVNVAPRTESIKKKWDNGTPFCYFIIGGALIVSTLSTPILSLLFRIIGKDTNGIASPIKVYIMDTSQVIKHASEQQWLPNDDAFRIINTQFRSYEFVPLVAYWITTRGGLNALPHRVLDSLECISDDEKSTCDSFVWFIDNFGNCKTSLLPEDVGFEENCAFIVDSDINSQKIKITSFKRLSDATPGNPCLVIGSSGYKNYRFLELVIKNSNFSVKTGTTIGPINITRAHQ